MYITFLLITTVRFDLSSDMENHIKNLIAPLYSYANLLTLVSPRNSKIGGLKFAFYKCYTFIVLSCLVFSQVLAFNTKILFVYPNENYTAFTMDIISTTCALVVAMVPSLKSVYNVGDYQEFFQIQSDLNKFLRSKNLVNNRSILFYFEIILVHIAYVLFWSYEAYVMVNKLGARVYSSYLIRNICIYECLIIILLVHNYAILFRKYIETINDSLISTNDTKEFRLIFHEKRALVRNEPQKELLMVKNAYCKLNSLFKIFNNIFGWPILLFSCMAIIGLLQAVNSCLSFSKFKPEMYVDRKNPKMEIISVSLSWFVVLMVS